MPQTASAAGRQKTHEHVGRIVPEAEIRGRRYAVSRDGGSPHCTDRLTSEGAAP
jgi:hypothetical protein